MEEPTGKLASAELSSKEVAPTRKPTRELAMPMAADAKLVGAPPLQDNVRAKIEDRVNRASSLVGWRC